MKTIVDGIHQWDVFFFSTIFGMNGRRVLASAMPWISHTGNGYYYPIIPLLVFGLRPDVALPFLTASLAAFAIEIPLFVIMKKCIKRDRPCKVVANVHQRIIPSDRFSFPSGHTAAAFVMATLIGYFFPLTILPVFGWAFLVGISRIFLGVHYPTDILAGIAIGVFTAMASIAVVC